MAQFEWQRLGSALSNASDAPERNRFGPSAMVGAEFVAVVPRNVRRVVDAWRSVGSPVQDGIAWLRRRWIDEFPQFAPSLAMLPIALTGR
jgi:hypothetical protein